MKDKFKDAKKLNKKIIYITVFSFSWALKIFFDKIALSKGVNPVAFVTQSVFISVLILTAYMLIKSKNELKNLNLDTCRGLFFAGFFLGMGYIAGLYGLKHSTSINYSFVIKSSIIFTPLLVILFLKEKKDKNRLYLIIAFIIGIYLILSGGHPFLPKISDLSILVSAFCFSCVVIAQKMLTKKANSTIIAWGRNFFALPIFMILAFFMKANITKIIFPELVSTVGFSCNHCNFYK